MLRRAFAALAVLSVSIAAAAVAAEPAPVTSAAPANYNSSDSQIGALLDDPAAKAVLQRHLPQLVSSAQIDMARSMTLKQIQGYSGHMISDDVLAKIDADLAKLLTK